jgi:putative MATE family efflux protein
MNKGMKDMTQGNPLNLIISFAIPLLVGNSVQLCYNLADTWIVGATLPGDSIAMIGATSALSALMISFLFGLTNGFSLIVANDFGANNTKAIKRDVAHAIKLTLITAAIMTIICMTFLDPLLKFFNVKENLYSGAKSYISVIFLFLIITAFNNLATSLLRAIGDSKTPMIFLIISAVLNIGLDFFFILVLKRGIAGAAEATILSQLVSLILCFIHILTNYPLLIVDKYDFSPDAQLDIKLYGTGLSMALMLSMVAIGTAALSTTINKFDEDILTAHTVTRKLSDFMMMPFAILGATMATYCGQNLGAKKYGRIKYGLRLVYKMAWVWCILMIIMCYTILPYLIKLLASVDSIDSPVVKTAVKYQQFDCLFFFVVTLVTITRNALQAIGDKFSPLISSFLELLVKVVVVILLTPKYGYWGIIVSEPIAWCLMVIPLMVSLKTRKELKGVKPSIEG